MRVKEFTFWEVHCLPVRYFKGDFNPKALSKLMGHAKELITVDVYGDNQNIIPEEIPELVSYMNDVMPKKRSGQDLKDVVLDTVIETEKYLPDK